MTISIQSCTTAPENGSMTALLRDYYDLMIERIMQMGGEVPKGDAIGEFWDHIDTYLPPNGQLLLAREDDSGELVGCAMLKRLDADKGEMKRLFVRPDQRGTGLGRRMIEMRIDAAREMGLTELMADTLIANVEMQTLYTKLGFDEIRIDPDSTTYQLLPELQPYLKFYRLTL